MGLRTACSLVLLLACSLATLTACGQGAQLPAGASIEPILKLDGGRLELQRQAFDLPAEAAATRSLMRPVPGSALRPVTLLELEDVHLLRLSTDRGVERVAIQGLGGRDRRLPPEIDAWLAGPGREQFAAWLTADGARLWETSLPVFGEGGARIGPIPHTDHDGLRVVTLARTRGSGEPEDVRGVAIERGWAWPRSTRNDPLALDVALPFREPAALQGVHLLPQAEMLREQHQAQRAMASAITHQELQLLGAQVTAAASAFLGWTPPEPLLWLPVTNDEALPLMLPAYEAMNARSCDWAQDLGRRVTAERAAAGLSGDAVVDMLLPEPWQTVASTLAEHSASSPLGPVVFLHREGELTPQLLEHILVHEFMHEYQERGLWDPDGFWPVDAPANLHEAHAESLAASFSRSRHPGWERFAGTGYIEHLQRFEAARAALGQSADDFLRQALGQQFERELWDSYRDHELGLEEWLFRQHGITEFDGLSFEPRLEPHGRPQVLVSNRAAVPFEGRLHGEWIWTFERGEQSGIVRLQGPPCDLVLPAGAALTLQLSHEPLWQDVQVGGVIGLLQRRPSSL